MLEVEGGTHDWCVKILRHEAGHAIDNAYHLQRRRKRRELFGAVDGAIPSTTRPSRTARASSCTSTPGTRRAIPTRTSPRRSRSGSTRSSNWRERYAGWPALKKLEYMDELMKELAGHPPRRVSRRKLAPLPSIKKTLRAALRPQARPLRRTSTRTSTIAISGGCSPIRRGAQGQPAGDTFPRQDPQARAAGASRAGPAIPLHHRPCLRGHDPPLPRAEPAADQAGRRSHARVHDSVDRPDHELPAQWQAPGGAMRKLRVLALMHDYLVPPEGRDRHRHSVPPNGRWSTTSPTPSR